MFVWCGIISIAIRVDIFNGMFYLFVNNVVWEVMINEGLFSAWLRRKGNDLEPQNVHDIPYIHLAVQ